MSLFVIRTNATFEDVKADQTVDKRLDQLQQLIACPGQQKGYIEMVPHTGEREEVVIVYCNEEAGLRDDAGFNDLGAAVLDVLGYDLRAFGVLAVRGPLVIAGFVDEEGDEVPLTEEQVKAATAMCTYIKKHNADLSAKQVHAAKMIGLCLFRRETKEAIFAADVKTKKKSAGAGAGAGSAAASAAGQAPKEERKAV